MRLAGVLRQPGLPPRTLGGNNPLERHGFFLDDRRLGLCTSCEHSRSRSAVCLPLPIRVHAVGIEHLVA